MYRQLNVELSTLIRIIMISPITVLVNLLPRGSALAWVRNLGHATV